MTYHAVYSDTDFDMCYDWNESLMNLQLCNDCHFLYRDGERIGMLTITLKTISNPFMVAPIKDRDLFWNIILKQMRSRNQEQLIRFHLL